MTEMIYSRKIQELLVSLSRQAAAETDLRKLLFFIVDKLLSIFPNGDSASIFFADHSRRMASMEAWAGFGSESLEGLEISYENSFVGEVISHAQPSLLKDTTKFPSFKKNIDPRIKDICSTMAVPIMFQNACIGAIFVDNRTTQNAFLKQDFEVLESIANQLAGNIANAKLSARIQQQVKKVSNEQEKAQKFLDIAYVMITALDRLGNITLINKKGAELLGYVESELIGKNWFELCIPEQNRKTALYLFQQFFSDGDSEGPEFDQIVITKSGQARILRAHSSAIRDENGAIIGSLTSGEDVTERVKTEEALRQYAHIVSSSSDMMAIVDLDCVYLSANQAYSSAFGLSPEKMPGKKAEDLFGKKFFHDVIRPRVDRCFAGEEVTFKEWIEFPKTEKKYMEIHYYPYRNDQGEVVGMVANRRDITESFNASEALRESEEKNRNILENITNIFYMHTPQGEVTFVSPQSMQILGYTPDEMLNAELWTKIVKDKSQVELAHELTEQMIENRTPTPPFAMELMHKNGNDIWVEVRESPLIVNGKIVAVIGSMNDITDRKIAEQEKNATIQQLEIAHSDLRQSYTSILQTMDETIRTISKTVEVRDPYTAGHHQRVSALSRAIAIELGLEDEAIKAVELAGIIHDLGKIQIPAEILSKPGKLTEIEFNMVKMHPTVGYELLKNITFPWPLAEIIHQHHEKLDGSGYPNGIKGDDIALESRILVVADIVEAMASHRPYRPALGIDAALEEVNKEAGKKLDSAVVRACNAIFARGYSFDE